MNRRPSHPLGGPKGKANGAHARANLLKPDILDEETRQLLIQQVQNPSAHHPSPTLSPHGLRPITPTSPAKSPRGRRTTSTATPVIPSSSPRGVDSNGAGYPTQLRAKVNAGSQAAGSSDLVSAMAVRLGELEKKHKMYQQEMGELREKNRLLSDRFQKEAKLREEAENLVVLLYEEKKELEKEVADMKRFLADYGLEWQGQRSPSTSQATSAQATPRQTPRKDRATGTSAADDEKEAGTNAREEGVFDLYAGDYVAPGTSSSSAAHDDDVKNPNPQGPPRLFSDGPQAKRDKTSTPAYSDTSPPDMALLKRNARILSDYVGSKGVVVTDGKKAAIRDRDVVTLVVYKNGICVNKGVFRPYGWALCDAFLKDLVEGFYPYEFKDKYPEGFPIEVVDRSQEMCETGLPAASKAAPQGTKPVAGEGRRLGGPTAANVRTMENAVHEKGYAPLSKDEFLARLPKQKITASGQLVNVRTGVADVLEHGRQGPPKPTPPLVQAPGGHDVSATVKHVSHAEAFERAKQAQAPSEGLCVGDLVAILVRLPSGQKVTLNVPGTTTIREVRQELSAAVPDFTQQHNYELCQAFPNARVFDEHTATLSSLDIARSCTMMLDHMRTVLPY